MRPLSPSGVLDLCDLGHGCSATTRALLLLASAAPEADWEELAALPLGERDRCLLQLRTLTLGPRLEAAAACPACGETAEIGLDTVDLLATGDAVPELELAREDLRLSVRPVSSGDLLAAEGAGTIEAARRRIAGRCLLGAWRGEETVAAEDLSAREMERVSEALAEADPGAELLLAVRCPSCGQEWREALDVASFFWSELESRSRRLLLEIHLLARAYGWRETDVLALSPRRRRVYLELIGA